VKLAVILGIALAGFAVAEESVPPVKAPADRVFRGGTGAPWLGLTVGRLDEAVRAQVPDLPLGIGFVVTNVEAGGPADQAGVKRHDIFWKLGDQWIANEAQLLTLLCLKKAGEEVTLGLYRTGEPLALPVVLERAPESGGLGKAPLKRPEDAGDLPMKVLRPADRCAEIEAADGRAVLSLVNGQPEVKITNAQGTLVYEGPVNDLKGATLVPESWQSRVGALERALAHASRGGRPVRNRVLPPAEEPEE
jgi:hypothetical protein